MKQVTKIQEVDFSTDVEFEFQGAQYRKDHWLANYFRKHLKMQLIALYSTKGQVNRVRKEPYEKNSKELSLMPKSIIVFFSSSKYVKMGLSEWLNICPGNIQALQQKQVYTKENVFESAHYGILSPPQVLDFALTHRHIYAITDIGAEALISRKSSGFLAFADGKLNSATKFPHRLICAPRFFLPGQDQLSVKNCIYGNLEAYYANTGSFTMFSNNNQFLEYLNSI